MSSVQTCIYEYEYIYIYICSVIIVSMGAGTLPKIPYAVDLIAISIKKHMEK